MTERKIWFITRPERDPRYHAEAMSALQEATNNFTLKWEGNRELHKHYEAVLASHKLKRNNISNDGSGGRTWCALLKTFAYCYIDKNGVVKPTKVGQALVDGIKEYENVKKQILTFQIPNAYFLERGFRPKFESSFRIRPARFLVKLVQREDLQYLISKEEITYFVLTAQDDREVEEIAKKILLYRQASPDEKEQMKQEIAVQYDHRARNDKAARDYYQAHSDVAHTFMMLCEYTGLVEYVRGNSILTTQPDLVEEAMRVLHEYDRRYPFNTRYRISIERMAQNNGLDVDSYKSNDYGNVKTAKNLGKRQAKIDTILGKMPNWTMQSDEELIQVFKESFGPRDAAQMVSILRKEQPALLNVSEQFVESYLGKMTPLEFEKLTGDIFKELGFGVVYQPKVQGTRTEIELLVRYGDRFGIIDTKYYESGFPLSQNLANYMGSEYIPNYLTYDDARLSFFGYVTSAGYSGEKKLQSITKLSEKLVGESIEGFMLTREVLLGFLDYCIENEIPKEERIQLFIDRIQNKAFDDLKLYL